MDDYKDNGQWTMDNKEDDGTTTRIMDTNEDNTQGQNTMMRTTDNGQQGG